MPASQRRFALPTFFIFFNTLRCVASLLFSPPSHCHLPKLLCLSLFFIVGVTVLCAWTSFSVLCFRGLYHFSTSYSKSAKKKKRILKKTPLIDVNIRQFFSFPPLRAKHTCHLSVKKEKKSTIVFQWVGIFIAPFKCSVMLFLFLLFFL